MVVAHGTVITLFVARRAGLEPFPFWKRLGLPAFVALSLPDYAVQSVSDHIEPVEDSEHFVERQEHDKH